MWWYFRTGPFRKENCEARKRSRRGDCPLLIADKDPQFQVLVRFLPPRLQEQENFQHLPANRCPKKTPKGS